jgi:hypothetical protein
MTGTNANHPDLSVRVTGFQAITSGYLTGIDLEGSSFKVDRHNLAMIALFNLLTHLRLINLIATLSKFFFAVAGLPNRHRFDLCSTFLFYFNVDVHVSYLLNFGRWL